MRLLMFFGFLILVGSTSAQDCIYVEGRCVEYCEEGTHSYTTGCDHLTPEATCDQPNPVPDTRSSVCDFSACYCNEPTVRDTVSGKCVTLDECPKKVHEDKHPKALNSTARGHNATVEGQQNASVVVEGKQN